MIYLVIGPSCSGKTQFVTNSFIKSDSRCIKDLIKITVTDTSILIGDYTTNNKVRGTDRISRSQLKLIAPQIIKSFNDTKLDIVAEGINVCWDFVLEDLIPYKEHIKLIYINCSKETSLLRNYQINENANSSWFKAVYTRSFNTFNKYKNVFDSYIVDTEHGVDFNLISLDTVTLNPWHSNAMKRLF
jgi:hypothetical protein